MADELPRPEDVGGAIWSHDWYSYEGYKTVHVRHLTNLLNEGIVEEDGLSFIEYRDARTLAAVNVTGRLKCSNGVIVEVDKWLEARPGQMVRGYSYSYQAWIAATGQEILRYDSSHGFDQLHCHLFDLRSGQETVLPVPLDRLPTLDGFVRLAVQRVQHAKA